jgi:hypothetical protein
MARCGTCGGKRRGETRGSGPSERRERVDPTLAVFAAATPRFKVVRSQIDQTGKTFSTQSAAEDYARRTGGIVQVL